MKRRNTAQRQQVLDAVSGRCDHPTAEQIHRELQEQGSSISRSTVYRNLCVLEDEGAVMEVEGIPAHRYDIRSDPHYHITCEGCGTVIDAPLDYQAAFDVLVGQLSGYHITNHQTMFTGLCPACASQREER